MGRVAGAPFAGSESSKGRSSGNTTSMESMGYLGTSRLFELAPRTESALGIERQLVTNVASGNPRTDVILETVCERDEQIIHAALFDDLGEHFTRFSTIVFPQEFADFFGGDIPGEI